MAEENKKLNQPSIILGLDISTACIGISIVKDDGINEPEIIEITHIVPKISNKIKGIEALILRKEIFEKDFLSTVTDMGITECVIESPLAFATGNSKAETIAQLLQFNGLLSEAVYRVLHIVPAYISSYDARMCSFPELLSLRKFNKKGEAYPKKQIINALKNDHLVLFGAYPFDCDKKRIMMNMVSEKYPKIDWIYGKNGELRKENFDACDALVCALAHINIKRYGKLEATIVDSEVREDGIVYHTKMWDKIFEKHITFV